MKYIINKTHQGFTLIELLVVIAIIGLLASTVLASLQRARAEARNSQRIQTLKELQKAVELYRLKNGSYPTGGDTGKWHGQLACSGGTTPTWYDLMVDNWIPGLVSSGFLAELPKDVNNDVSSCRQYMYLSNAGGTGYKIMATNLAESNAVIIGEPFSRCDVSCSTVVRPYCAASYSFAVYSDDFKCN